MTAGIVGAVISLVGGLLFLLTRGALKHYENRNYRSRLYRSCCAYELVKQHHEVVVFEKDREPGGLAVGYKEKEWEWSLEKHYHHCFTNDKSILSLAKEINYEMLIKRPKTSVLSAINLSIRFSITVLLFPLLSVFED